MSNLMWRSKNEADNKPKKNVDQKTTRLVSTAVPGYLTAMTVRQPRYYMEEINQNTNACQRKPVDRTMTGVPAVSLGGMSPVIQLESNIKAETNFIYPGPDDSVPELPQIPFAPPVMIFESMGTKMSNCEAIYRQSCAYKGNTICVFGLNTEADDDNLDIDLAEVKKLNDELTTQPSSIVGSAASSTQDGTTPPYVHLLYVFRFVWKKPRSVDASEYYKMPYAEARLTVMKKAKKIVENDKIFPTDGYIEKKPYVLYRWIDEDARDDTSNELLAATEKNKGGEDIPLLRGMALADRPVIVSGGYDWRHESETTSTEKRYYSEFILELNRAEQEVRNQFFLIARANKITLPKPTTNNLIPGYYFPESTLLMNHSAHEAYITYESNLETDEIQDKESMRLLSLLLEEYTYFHRTDLRATKPLKHEFIETSTDGRSTYLNKNMLNFLRKLPKANVIKFLNRIRHNPPKQNSPEARRLEEIINEEIKDFVAALKKLRQSAFSDWSFLFTDAWTHWEQGSSPDTSSDVLSNAQRQLNDIKREKMIALWAYLQEVPEGGGGKTRLQLIRDELNPPK